MALIITLWVLKCQNIQHIFCISHSSGFTSGSY